MKTSNIELIKRHEGIKLASYQDVGGVWTIGYGHTKHVRQGDTITESQAEWYLYQDVKEVEDFLNGHGLTLTQCQFDALVSFGFNVGIGNLSKSTLFRKLKNDPFDWTIYCEFCRWIKAGGQAYKGLLRRRIAEANHYFNDVL